MKLGCAARRSGVDPVATSGVDLRLKTTKMGAAGAGPMSREQGGVDLRSRGGAVALRPAGGGARIKARG
jgi:hypothetical protein